MYVGVTIIPTEGFGVTGVIVNAYAGGVCLATVRERDVPRAFEALGRLVAPIHANTEHNPAPNPDEAA